MPKHQAMHCLAHARTALLGFHRVPLPMAQKAVLTDECMQQQLKVSAANNCYL
jgi:hypothetical protein